MLCKDYEGIDLVFFFKDMAYYMRNKLDLLLEGGLKDFKHSFLIRDPAEVMTSLYRVYKNLDSPGYSNFNQADTGFQELYHLYQFVTEHLDLNPVVVDADDLLDNPSKVLKNYCKAVGIRYEASMTSWEPGPWTHSNPGFCLGWHTSVEKSSGFTPRVKKQDGVLQEQEFPEEVVKVIKEATPYYNKLAAKKQS
ncbi:branched-chain-amino-acid aminotransferase-like protein 2 [Exaiptasia diaphana]|uniref:Sulfotransferase family protein n=1 Tax=Exaiptasia diaphana TaxID=2652724 RepID=A0A913XF50_EXADI|nr:branched-chain-amino-acid aminotransferase-like protein 2 [Exaiptasia diaphana]